MIEKEGILDSLIYILRSFFKTYASILRDSSDGTIRPETYMADPSFFHSKLAANCCIALGKAHCALVHTAGDLLLMSSYTHGTVPVTRQLAQMLHEVPHHTAVTRVTTDTNSGELEDFMLSEMSLQNAEDFAKSIHSLAEGRIDIPPA